jgi:hypothetical protein
MASKSVQHAVGKLDRDYRQLQSSMLIHLGYGSADGACGWLQPTHLAIVMDAMAGTPGGGVKVPWTAP